VRNIHSKRLVTYNRRSICVKVSTKARSPVRRGEANIDIDEYINTSRREKCTSAIPRERHERASERASERGGGERAGQREGEKRKRGKIKTVYLRRGATRAAVNAIIHAYITWRYRSRRTHARCCSRVHNDETERRERRCTYLKQRKGGDL